MTSVTKKHVLAFLNACPEDMLREFKVVVDGRLGVKDEPQKTEVDEKTEFKRNVMRAFMFNEEEPSEPAEQPKSIREQLAAMTKDIPEGGLQSQLNQMKGDNEWRDVKTEIIFKYQDQYGDALVVVVGADLNNKLKAKLEQCKADGQYFPWGLGKEKVLLKIKKHGKGKKEGEKYEVNLNFTKWSRDGRSGYSCYCK